MSKVYVVLVMEVQLIIRAPNQNIDDHAIHCNLDWTVLKLKNHLSEVYPSRPVTEEQKLIYSGRLLHDHLHLRDILRHEDGQTSTHILHLVCYEKNNHICENSSTSHEWHSPTTVTQPNEPSNSDAEATTGSTSRHRNNHIVPEINFQAQPQLGLPATTTPVFASDPQFLAHMAAMQQMYAYYMAQYLQSMNTATASAGGPIFPNISNLQDPHNNVNYAQNDIPAQRPANQRMNAQGGQVLEDNDDMGHRDWLDHAFLCCRFFLLFTIIYFYSTPERLMIVIVCAIIAFLYHEGWFVRRATPVVPRDILSDQRNRHGDVNPHVVNNANEPPLANPNLSANEELHDGHELEAAMDGDEPPHAQNPDVVNNNQIFSPFTFLAAFFSSLIPEPPPPVNIN